MKNELKLGCIAAIPTLLVISLIGNIKLLINDRDNNTESSNQDLFLQVPIVPAGEDAPPQLGFYQLTAKGLNDDHAERLSGKKLDYYEDTIDVEFESIMGKYYGVNVSRLRAETHNIDPETKVNWVVYSEPTVGVLYISYQYIFDSAARCEKTTQYVRDTLGEQYAITWQSDLSSRPPVFAKNYGDIVFTSLNDEYQVAVSADCQHQDFKDLIVRVGINPDVFISDYLTLNTNVIDKSLFAFR